MKETTFSYQYPFLYRYEDEEYVDRFFQAGEIMISSFQVYKTYPDNQLGDTEEGKSKTFEESRNLPLLKSFAKGHTQAGNNSYCFCTSTNLDPALLNIFRRNSVFRIKEMTGFAVELANAINESTGQIFFGNCDYLSERNITNRLGEMKLSFLPDDPSIPGETFFSMTVFGNKLLFMKTIKYQGQCEYRIILPTTTAVTASAILKCPGAVNYCERVSKEELEEVKRQLR